MGTFEIDETLFRNHAANKPIYRRHANPEIKPDGLLRPGWPRSGIGNTPSRPIAQAPILQAWINREWAYTGRHI